MWWNNVYYYFFRFYPYILIVLAFGFAAFAAVLFLTRRVRLQGIAFTLAAFFYRAPTAGLLRLSFALSRLIFVLYLLLSRERLEIYHIALLLLLAAAGGLASLSIFRFLGEIANTAALCAGLYVCQMLYGYMREIRFSTDILVTWFMLGIFLLIYSLIIFLNCAGQIAESKPSGEREKKKRKKKEEQKQRKGVSADEA